MAQDSVNGLNLEFPIYNANGTPFQNLVIHKATLESVVMSFGDKLTGDVYYKDNSLAVTMTEYILVNGIKYILVSPPTILREGMVSDNSELKGMTKYSFVFYHPMCMVGNFPFTDVAVDASQSQYLSDSKTFSWMGNLVDFTAKINANLVNTEWYCGLGFDITSQDPSLASLIEKAKTVCKEVFTFDNNFVTDACKKGFEEWEIPYVIQPIASTDPLYSQGKRFAILFTFPNQEILDSNNQPFVFKFGQGVGLKNNSRTPKNNKIVTRIVGYGSENNIPYGYPQIRWYGNPSATQTQDGYPIYKGIVGGEYVQLIKHPFTRKNLMPTVYVNDLFNKVSLYLPNGSVNPNYNPDIVIRDYYDADGSYPNPLDPNNPCVEIHKFEDIKPELGEKEIVSAAPYDNVYKDPLEEAIALDDFLAQITADLNEPNKVTNQNERSALDLLYQILDTDDGERHFMNQGGSYTFSCAITKDSDYYYVKYVSDNINYDVVCIQRGHIVRPTWDDTMNDEGEYVQSYFKITLPSLGFDLYACASITESMQINMRSGACIGCTFPIQVDWEDYKRNFYNADGEFDPIPHTQEGDGHVRDITKYPDSTNEQITLVVQKDLDTFGTLMPNIYQQPQSRDQFVILGISLPQSYVTNAQYRLDSAMEEYMLENNIHYYEYPLKFDEFFLAQNTNILAQIHNYSIVRFEYPNGGNQNALYVKQMVVKYGDKPLPQYDITLTDDIEIVLNQIGQVTDDVSRMRVQVNELQKYYSQNLIDQINQKLSKVSDDVAQGLITFQQGLDAIGRVIFSDELRSKEFRTGLYDGKGWRIDNLGNAEFESARIRSYLEVVELLVNRMRAQEGDTMFTDNDQIDKVEDGGNGTYILSLKQKFDGYVTSQLYGNILKGVINTLAAKQAGVSDETSHQQGQEQDDGGNKYYTSWMQVTGTHATEENVLGVNQIRVVLYGDVDQQGNPIVPSGRNFPPCELMTIARYGCWQDPNEQGISAAEKLSREQRQRVFVISTSDGRVTKYSGVNKPILENYNYGVTIGELPDFVKAYPDVASVLAEVGEHTDWLYAQGIVVGNYIKVDRDGRPEVKIIDCHNWVDGSTILNPTPQHGIYYVNQWNEQTRQFETHDVWHEGHRWRCHIPQPVVDTQAGTITYYEPQWNSPYWEMIEGDDMYSLTFKSTNGNSFRRGYVDTYIRPHLMYGNNEEITHFIANEYWSWTRMEERNMDLPNPYTAADIAWNAQHTGQMMGNSVKNFHLTNEDMVDTWSSRNKMIFTCRVSVSDGRDTIIVENQLIS